MHTVDKGFKFFEMKKGEEVQSFSTEKNVLLIVKAGKIRINCNEFHDRIMGKDGIVIIPRHAKISGIHLEDSEILVFLFDIPHTDCDKLLFTELAAICKTMTYDFNMIEVRSPMGAFIDFVTYCLRNGMFCSHLHYSLESILFFQLRGFYTKEELAALFYPILSRDLDFRDFVLSNYSKVQNVNQLIELSNMGRSKFFNFFKANFDCTAYQFLTRRKNESILEALARPGITVKDLVNQFKFDSASHFTHYVIKNFNCTPKELIEKYNKFNKNMCS
jgi:AraC-like DNA-binding protein